MEKEEIRVGGFLDESELLDPRIWNELTKRCKPWTGQKIYYFKTPRTKDWVQDLLSWKRKGGGK